MTCCQDGFRKVTQLGVAKSFSERCIDCLLSCGNEQKKKKRLYRLYNAQDFVLTLIMDSAKATRMRKSTQGSQSGAVAFWQNLFGWAQRLSFIKGHRQPG